MNQKEMLQDIIDAILKHNEDGEDMVEMLLTTATLLNELRSGRFRGADYKKTVRFDRLSVTLQFDKYRG
jgi:hypothetical protein